MKEAFYFSHDANAQHDPKIIKMLSKMGWEGYGIYWAIVERLRNEPSYTLECDYDCIAYALRVNRDSIKSIVLDYNLFEVNNGIFWSDSLMERMQKKDEISKKARKSALKRWYPNANAKRKQCEPNAIKEIKEKKVNKKEQDEAINVLFTKFWFLYDKKVGDKFKVKKKWYDLTDDERVKVMKTLPSWKKQFSEKQYQPFPATYLNQRRWEDEIEVNNVEEWRKDVMGVSYIGYCSKCFKSEFYKTTNEDSLCCKVKIVPNKPNSNVKLNPKKEQNLGLAR